MTSVDEIKILLQKNKKRFLNEVEESKELAFLLKKSFSTKLTEEEKKKVREQVLDICKSIPAFAIFMLPGGALLLPLLIKLIPTILPSSFREE
ncbi:LETM1-like protein [Tenacibaculum adriaticum]|uniref:LETM1-like protein n=1 Tax=Tenacibaculum adriaticum TaxID=413713 RepID=A0A5S5DT76_9FLAO|nr:LETM1 domain-containing protein [Tenacibaculum adriaticum]TYP99077.1 LETM1-like protein [Tenacibaculum adriaticum]